MGKRLLTPYSETVQAGKVEIFPFEGKTFYLSSVSVPVTLVFMDSYNNELGRADGAFSGFAPLLMDGVQAVRIITPSTQVVEWYEAAEGVDLNKITGSIAATIAQATVTDNVDPVTLGTAAALALGADSGRRRLILTGHRDNGGAIALGGPALTAANAARWLEAGESYVENDAAPSEVWALAEIAGDKLCIEVA